MERGGQDELVTRAQAGDEDAWAELYGDHAERLVIWLRHLPHLDPAADAEDVAAEAWLTAARRVGDFTGDRGDFAGWLFGIARNVARSGYRAARRRPTTSLEPDPAPGPYAATADPAWFVASADLARRLIAELPEREAQVVTCIDVVGLDVATTGRALDIQASAVRVAHHRGLRRLRELLTAAEASANSPQDVTPGASEGM